MDPQLVNSKSINSSLIAAGDYCWPDTHVVNDGNDGKIVSKARFDDVTFKHGQEKEEGKEEDFVDDPDLDDSAMYEP